MSSLVHSPSAHTHRAQALPVLVRLSERERSCLMELHDSAYGEEGYGVYFRTIVTGTGLRLDQVRRSVRALARKGLVELNRGLFTDDGMIAGSGYGLTREGIRWVKATTANSVGTQSPLGDEVNPNSTGEPHPTPVVDDDDCDYIPAADHVTTGDAHELALQRRAATCVRCGGRGEIGGAVGQTAETFEWVTEPCPDCTASPEAQPDHPQCSNADNGKEE